MLREPKNAQTPTPLRKDKKTGRFQLMKLEERIAPSGKGVGCHTNPQGKKVGNCGSVA